VSFAKTGEGVPHVRAMPVHVGEKGGFLGHCVCGEAICVWQSPSPTRKAESPSPARGKRGAKPPEPGSCLSTPDRTTADADVDALRVEAVRQQVLVLAPASCSEIRQDSDRGEVAPNRTSCRRVVNAVSLRQDLSNASARNGL